MLKCKKYHVFINTGYTIYILFLMFTKTFNDCIKYITPISIRKAKRNLKGKEMCKTFMKITHIKIYQILYI